ncbi:Polyubiquitin [Diplonema papillatum]|nr:Polyubiquitin [Diplonema papillatum]
MASLTVHLDRGTSVKGTYLNRREANIPTNPKVYVIIEGKVVGASEKVERTRDPEWDATFECTDLPAGTSSDTPMTLRVAHANNYGGEELIVGYATVKIGQGAGGKPQELKLLSEDTKEEHGGALFLKWDFKEGPKEKPPAPAAEAVKEAKKTPEPAPPAVAPAAKEPEKAPSAILADLERQDREDQKRGLAGVAGLPAADRLPGPAAAAASAQQAKPTVAVARPEAPQANLPPQRPPTPTHQQLLASASAAPQHIPLPVAQQQDPDAAPAAAQPPPPQSQPSTVDLQVQRLTARKLDAVKQERYLEAQQLKEEIEYLLGAGPAPGPPPAAKPPAKAAAPVVRGSSVQRREAAAAAAAAPAVKKLPSPSVAAPAPKPPSPTDTNRTPAPKPAIDAQPRDRLRSSVSAAPSTPGAAAPARPELAETPKAAPAPRVEVKRLTEVETGCKVVVLRRLELSSGVTVEVGDVGECVKAPGKPAVVEFAEDGICFACDDDEVEPIEPPRELTIPGHLPASVAKGAATRQAVSEASRLAKFAENCCVRTLKTIQFSDGRTLPKHSLGRAVKVPGSLAIVRVGEAVFSADEGDVEPHVEYQVPAVQHAQSEDFARKFVTFASSPALSSHAYPSPSTGHAASIPYIEVPQHIRLQPPDHSPQHPDEPVASRGPVDESVLHLLRAERAHPPRDASPANPMFPPRNPEHVGDWISVRVVSPTGSTHVLRDLHPEDTVMRVKRLLQAETSVPVLQQALRQELVNGGSCLMDDRRSLSSYDVRRGDTLHLTVMRGNVPLILRLPNGKVARLSAVRYDETVLALKRRIHDAANIPITRQRLIVGSTGAELSDRKTLEASNVFPGDEIFVDEKDHRNRPAPKAALLRLSVADETVSAGHPHRGRALPLHCSIDETVLTAKRSLAGRLGITPSLLHLACRGVVLRDAQRMKDAVQHGASGLVLCRRAGIDAEASFEQSMLRQQVSSVGRSMHALSEKSAALSDTIRSIRQPLQDSSFDGNSAPPYVPYQSSPLRSSSLRRGY